MEQLPLPMKPEDFSRRRLSMVFEPLDDIDAWAWSASSVRAARQDHLKGDFRQSARLAHAVTCDPSIFGALLNRTAPARALPRYFESPLARLATAAEREIEVSPGTVMEIVAHLAMLGMWVGQVEWTPRADGSRLDVRLRTWPMRSVYYDQHRRQLLTHTRGGQIVPVVHGDGKWVVATASDFEPWQWGAIKGIGMHWVHRAHHIRDRGWSSEAHGQSKFIGELPDGVDLNSDGGQAFVAAVKELRNRRSGMAHPKGAKVYQLEAVSQMWQIFKEAIASVDQDVARALLGQDGSLANEGGNYIKAAQLFGVRSDIVEGDLVAMQKAWNEGVLRPWAAVNFGELDRAPTIEWAFPDPDEAARRAARDDERKRYGERMAAMLEALASMRDLGLVIDQPTVRRMAERYGVDAPEVSDEQRESPTPGG